MTLEQLVRKTAASSGNSIAKTKQVIGQFCDHIADAVKSQETVTIKGLFVMRPKILPPREGVNPKTRQKIMLKECKSVTMTPSAQFKNWLNGRIKAASDKA